MGTRAWVAGVSVALLWPAGCGGDTSPEEKAARRAQGAIATLRMRLKQRLDAALATGDVAAAVEVCATEAPALRDAVTRDMGVRLGRASLRRRNPEPVAPAWVTDWLRSQGERPAAGVAGQLQTVGRTVQVLEPIAVGPACLTCHGPAESRSDSLRESLARHYPADEASGYAEGDLRGAFWAEADF
jgi:hypothetical protein